ncbi:MAG TPA: hypothetical protein VH500_08400 [Nitrososphaeraceae archaeon]|jgi:hypothetical protein
MPRWLVNREELRRLIAQTSDAITMIKYSIYTVKSKSGNKTYNVTPWSTYLGKVSIDVIK